MTLHRYEWTIKAIEGDPQRIEVVAGQPVFVLGPNGSGKSALLVQLMKDADFAEKQKISAHRQGWFAGSTIEHAPKQLDLIKLNHKAFYGSPHSRYSLSQGGAESSLLIHELLDATARRNARIVSRIQADPGRALAIADAEPSPLDTVNEILANATLTAQLEASGRSEMLARHDSDASFGIAELSDGERNAISLAIQVVTAPPGTLLIIDEPERHLHPSIARPLIATLFHRREDCAFVVATHDPSLPGSHLTSPVVLLRRCIWENRGQTNAWDVDIVTADSDLPEELLTKIFGSRRTILFVEGTQTSLDLPMYAGLFPGLSVEPVESCDRVIQCVKGIRSSHGKHRLRALGLIDRDDRPDSDVETLAHEGIYALNMYSVEALYYCGEARTAVARTMEATYGTSSAQQLCDAAIVEALAALGSEDSKSRLPARRAERTMRNSLLAQLPDWKALVGNAGGEQIRCSVTSPFAEESKRYQQLLDAYVDGLLRRYPVRNSQVLSAIARTVCRQNRARYESVLLSCIRSDQNLADELRDMLGGLAKELAETPSSQVSP